MTYSIETWWWTVRHPFKTAAIRRFIASHDGDDPKCKLWAGNYVGRNLRARCSVCNTTNTKENN